jgi:hypothetical protein
VEEIPGPRVVEEDEGVMVSPGITTVAMSTSVSGLRVSTSLFK